MYFRSGVEIDGVAVDVEVDSDGCGGRNDGIRQFSPSLCKRARFRTKSFEKSHSLALPGGVSFSSKGPINLGQSLLQVLFNKETDEPEVGKTRESWTVVTKRL